MQPAPLPPNENERLAALRALAILDTDSEERFDRLTRLAQRLLGVRIALVSLVDKDRQWFKSHQGLEARQTARDIAFCGYTILSDELFIVEDAKKDLRFHDNPLVTGEPHIRFYAAYPLHAPAGHRVGSFCTIDSTPRRLAPDEVQILKDLAALAERELALADVQREANFMRIQASIAEIISEAGSIKELLGRLLGAVCESSGWDVGALWTIDEVAGALRCTEIWHTSKSGPTEFDRVTRERTFERGVGLPGQVWASGQPAWIEDLVSDPDFLRAPFAVKSGLKSGFALPVKIFGHVIGVLEFFSRKPLDLDARFLSAMGTVGTQVGQYLEWKASESRFRSMVENAPQAILTIDRDGRIVSMNSMVETIFGWRHDELIGQPVEVLLPAHFRAAHPGHREGFFRDPKPRAMGTGRDLSGLTKDGREVPIEIALSPLRTLDGFFAVATITDISERKKAEEAVRQARDAAIELARIKSDFLANMSHEIRTPLNAIIGVGDLLADTPLNPEQEDLLCTIRSASNSLLDIINDILDFSKLEAGAVQLEETDFDLREVLEEAVHLLALRAQKKGLEIAIWMDTSLPRHVRGDPARLRQVLVNFLSNAVKFTEKGEVILKAVREEGEGPGVELRLEISDTGMGIPEQARGRLFKAFSQVDASTTRRFGGTGLGLIISSRLAALMGGEIGFASEPERGSTFHFRLRVKPGAEPEAEPLLGQAKVLVVDDNASSREILLYEVRTLGLSAEAAAGGAEALAALQAAAGRGAGFDVVILDMQMPGMDGLETARAILEQGFKAAMLLLTSRISPPPTAVLSEAGIARTLTKPVFRTALRDALAGLLALPRMAKAVPKKAAEPKKMHQPRRHFQILLVEDNEVNQKVALLQLKKLGYQADVAGNGKEALKFLTEKNYDLVLMDCQMPEMDGYQTTFEIRSRNWPSRTIAIAAMTASSLKGDREKCLAAGMNDYLAKPIRIEDLKALLNRWDAPLDRSVLNRLREAAGPEAPSLIGELVSAFAADGERRLSAMREAARSGDLIALARETHALKGMCSNLGALRMQTLCARIEAAIRSAGPAQAGEWMEALQEEFDRAKAALSEVIHG